MAPSEKEICDALETEVVQADLQTTSLKAVRQNVIELLELDADFFRHPEWKQRSANVVDEAIARKLKEDQKSEENDEKVESHTDQPPEQDEIPEESSEEELIDEPVKPKKKRARKSEPKSAPKKPTTAKKLAKFDDAAAKIKTLQSQLVKCGIRRVWSKVLGPMPDDRARIKYLTEQLHDIGMTGRFSLAKATKIKEQRELDRDIQDVVDEAGKFTASKPDPAPAPSRAKRIIMESDSE